MQILSVVGARPQFVKLAPISHECERVGITHTIVHTGQHYDPLLSDVFFAELNIPAPDEHLGVGSGSHGLQTGAMLSKLDEILDKYRPDWVLVYGDTNSTLAAALSAVKLHYPIAHLEAGLRSFNRAMPEEHNRVLTDHAADVLLAPTQVAADHLAHEGLAERTVVVGDVMTDVLLEELSKLDPSHSPVAAELGLAAGSYLLATIHRAENTDDPQRLAAIISSLQQAPDPIVILAHPRLVAKCADHGLPLEGGNLRVHAPLPYADLLASAMHAKGIVTDSGGLQKEAFLMRVPCTTVRTETEWVETVELGWNVLAEPGQQLAEAIARPRPAATEAAPYGTGDAAQKVVAELIKRAK
ncbi:non-hydrolyzing UDP-N-acetylglucosamine 2-epimerase [Trueperella pecoris]|uniref:UDP-N-acetylglucosamine 2-epimerase (Non-hydrolyzing) n=1 Tax=Trueperella pecoris TaxID=2733571 RepID=A0A7M1QSS4_9ACTO|nr:UDP-N-acetylglucosamine 2-epimerase (non-hydrolyzing) [Trueperella pecoris]QOR45202.1 UDP-N-acetylglucosamine 2-epimerase (non-hydrolyzing) [Trueperella pecoris]QTG75106.1 UDP-N-acetylglucosamine 2-epimerase (non-hydrolyzing) [Trueperella pecoris]